MKQDKTDYCPEESRRIQCTKCGNSHIWVCTNRSKAKARWCQVSLPCLLNICFQFFLSWFFAYLRSAFGFRIAVNITKQKMGMDGLNTEAHWSLIGRKRYISCKKIWNCLICNYYLIQVVEIKEDLVILEIKFC